jgi:Coenzyme PQQ synthesis protein D (PqqD)
VHDELLSDGSLVLYNGCRGQVMTLNATAALVWECCAGEQDVESIIAEVQDVFPDAAAAENDVRQLMDKLLQAGMIAPAIADVVASGVTH